MGGRSNLKHQAILNIRICLELRISNLEFGNILGQLEIRLIRSIPLFLNYES